MTYKCRRRTRAPGGGAARMTEGAGFSCCADCARGKDGWGPGVSSEHIVCWRALEVVGGVSEGVNNFFWAFMYILTGAL